MDHKRSFSDLIKSIYLYLFTAVGLVLIIVGVFQLSNYIIKITVFEKYNLGYEETRCDYLPQSVAPGEDKTATGTAKTEKEKCEKTTEELRKFKKVTDGARAVTFLLVGGAVFAFHLRRTTLLGRKD